MKENKPVEAKSPAVEVDPGLNQYAGLDLSPKKREHIDSIAEFIKVALDKFHPEPANRVR